MNPLPFTTTDPPDWLDLIPSTNATPLERGEWDRLRPDVHCFAERDGVLLARCSAWKDSLPADNGSRPGAIGHFAAETIETGQAVLEAACAWLRKAGRTRVIGPIDANTWNRYRLVDEHGTHPPFFLEPWQPEWANTCWKQTGFTPLAEYHSTRFPPQTESDPRLARVCERLTAAGLTLRPLRLDDFENELRRIHSVSRISFANNLLYTPISEADFIAMYQPLRDRIDPQWVWIAEHEGACVGYVFALPDYAQAQRGAPVDTLIVKTLAILPEQRYAGLGQWLTRHIHQKAADAGFSTVIHALMHSASRIKHFGRDEADVFRRYTLYQRNA